MQAFAAEVTLSWRHSPSNDVEAYKVYIGLSSRNYDSYVDVGYITSYTVHNLLNKKRYYFAGTAYDFSGNESYYSNEATYRQKRGKRWKR